MKDKFLAVGCSHTAGTGIESKEIYVNLFAEEFNLICDNRAVPGGNSEECLINIVQALREYQPKFIIAQWPNVYRKTLWAGNKKILQNINSFDESFNLLFRLSDQNFIRSWLNNIITADTLAKQAKIKIYHIYLDEYLPEIDMLKKQSIIVHYDEKIKGKSWIFDNSAADKVHHSPRCHRLWVERLKEIVNENTSL